MATTEEEVMAIYSAVGSVWKTAQLSSRRDKAVADILDVNDVPRQQHRRRNSDEERRESKRASDRVYRDKNGAAIRRRAAEYQTNNKEKISRLRVECHRRKEYGLTPQAFDAMFAAQKGLCEVCSTEMIPAGKGGDTACVDHDHETGGVRALLCRKCNAALGGFNDDPELTDKATQYLKRHAEK